MDKQHHSEDSPKPLTEAKKTEEYEKKGVTFLKGKANILGMTLSILTVPLTAM